MTEVLPLLYLHGLSTSDFGPALEQFLGSGAGLSATTITRLTAQWQDEAKSFGQRDLSGTDYVYLWVDGIHLKVRLEQEKLCLLVMIGVRSDGRKELVALTDGYRESTESWADLLRGCRPPWDDRPGACCRRRGAGVLEGDARGVPRNPRAAVLVSQAG
jgi:transposase-like protein